jgi:hypothetical protein
MRWPLTLTLLCLLVLASACESDRGRSVTTVEPSIIASPTPTPSPAPSPSAWLWVMVVDHGGGCIADATVEVVRGQGLVGQSFTQQTPCGAWDYDGGVVFKNLTPGVEMTHLLAFEQAGDKPQPLVHDVTLLPRHAPSSTKRAKCHPCGRNTVLPMSQEGEPHFRHSNALTRS